MKIITLTAENIKKLSAVFIKPDGNLVQITGKNGQGKTSVLDSIWWALAGTSHIQAEPIKKGATQAKITLDLGDLIVRRTFKNREGKKYITSITVENAEGARFQSPQTMLDDLLGALAFDPLAFTRMSPAEQFDALKGFVPDLDFEKLEAEHFGDYERRRALNVAAREKRASVGEGDPDMTHLRVEGEGEPAKPIDVDALLKKIRDAGEHNEEVMHLETKDNNLRNEVTRQGNNVRNWEAEVSRLDVQIIAAKKAIANTEEQLRSITIPKRVDVHTLNDEIAEAQQHNRVLEKQIRYAEVCEQAEALEKESQALTDKMEKREKKKREAIAKAKLPVEGIEFGDNMILFKGVPFDQASDSEKLRVSVAIAMASNSKLRVLRIRDGSLLDDDALKTIADMADKEDYQIWIERVDSSGKIGFVLEDGALKKGT